MVDSLPFIGKLIVGFFLAISCVALPFVLLALFLRAQTKDGTLERELERENEIQRELGVTPARARQLVAAEKRRRERQMAKEVLKDKDI